MNLLSLCPNQSRTKSQDYGHADCCFSGHVINNLGEIMKSIIAGIVLIAVGFALGDSVFLGNFGLMSLFFDGLGLFWIGQGALKLWRERQVQH